MIRCFSRFYAVGEEKKEREDQTDGLGLQPKHLLGKCRLYGYLDVSEQQGQQKGSKHIERAEQLHRARAVIADSIRSARNDLGSGF